MLGGSIIMADDLPTGICGGNWWNSARAGFSGLSSPCSVAPSDIGSLGWQEIARSCEDAPPVSISDSAMVFRDPQKPRASESADGSTVLIDSTLHMPGFGLSPPTVDWSQALLRSSGRAESNFQAMLLEEPNTTTPNFPQETSAMESHHQIQKDWSPKNFMSNGEDTSVNMLKQINQTLNLEHCLKSEDDCAVTCQGLPTNCFSMVSSSFGSPSMILHGLLDSNPQRQQAVFDSRSPINYMSSSEMLPSWPKFTEYLDTSSPKQQPPSQLHFSNNTPFWNASAAAVANNIRPNYYPFPQTQFLSHNIDEKPGSSNLAAKPKSEENRDSISTTKKPNNETAALKRPRIETPSPLPTFKVRKEKLGDRITALQQLVSPFGKTDTASVLFEAIEYIKFLHEQVNMLSAPYMKNGAPSQHQQNNNNDKLKEGEGPKQDLRSRGLCLVPTSSTFPVTNEATADFWTPTFGGTFR